MMKHTLLNSLDKRSGRACAGTEGTLSDITHVDNRRSDDFTLLNVAEEKEGRYMMDQIRCV